MIKAQVPSGVNAKRGIQPAVLPAVQPCVAGIDLGSKEHWVCAPAKADGSANVRVFRTTTTQLQELADWLIEQGVKSVAMESTHVYWIPLYELLESRGIEALLVNARQLHNVPGRKTDMHDCQWLQLLHSCGLLKGSFRPDESICHLRALHRQLENLIAERSRVVLWMQKALDQMNIQIHRAVTDLTGATGMAILRAIVSGERDPRRLAALRDKRCKKSENEIAEYLTGNWRDEHLFNLSSALNLFDVLQDQIAAYDARLHQDIDNLKPPERQQEQAPEHPNPTKAKTLKKSGEEPRRNALWGLAGVDLTRIDGISAGVAQTILTEVGPDLRAFPTEKHFISWLRLSPRTPISGGKPLKKKRNGTGSNRISGDLRMAALSLTRSKTALGAYYRNTARRKDGSVAIFATARKLAQHVYRMLRYGQDYVDIGEQAYEKQFAHKRLSALERAAKSLGYTLQLEADVG